MDKDYWDNIHSLSEFKIKLENKLKQNDKKSIKKKLKKIRNAKNKFVRKLKVIKLRIKYWFITKYRKIFKIKKEHGAYDGVWYVGGNPYQDINNVIDSWDKKIGE